MSTLPTAIVYWHGHGHTASPCQVTASLCIQQPAVVYRGLDTPTLLQPTVPNHLLLLPPPPPPVLMSSEICSTTYPSIHTTPVIGTITHLSTTVQECCRVVDRSACRLPSNPQCSRWPRGITTDPPWNRTQTCPQGPLPPHRRGPPVRSAWTSCKVPVASSRWISPASCKSVGTPFARRASSPPSTMTTATAVLSAARREVSASTSSGWTVASRTRASTHSRQPLPRKTTHRSRGRFRPAWFRNYRTATWRAPRRLRRKTLSWKSLDIS